MKSGRIKNLFKKQFKTIKKNPVHIAYLLLCRAGVLYRSPEKWCWLGRAKEGCLFDVISHGRIGGDEAGDVVV